MSVGWIKTEEQRERHKDGCRRRYLEMLAADPALNEKTWAKKYERIISMGQLEEYRRERRVIRKRSYQRNRDRQLQPDKKKREIVVNALGGKCVSCGFSADIRALVLDHKNGDGHLDRKRVGSRIGRYYSQNIEEAREKLQVLCCNCNAIKAIDQNEHNKSRRLPLLIDALYDRKKD